MKKILALFTHTEAIVGDNLSEITGAAAKTLEFDTNDLSFIRDVPYPVEAYKYIGTTPENEIIAKKITAVIYGILHNYELFFEEALPWVRQHTNLTESDLADIYHDMHEASLLSDYYLDRIESASAVVMIYNYNSYHAIPIVRNKNTDTVGYLETGGGLIWFEPGVWAGSYELEKIGEIPKGYLQQSKVKS